MATPAAPLALFADAGEREQLRAAWRQEPGATAGTLALAWALRQCDPAEARSLLQGLAGAEAHPALQARALLIEGEQAWLMGQPEQAHGLVDRALALGAAEPLLRADAHYLRARLHMQATEPAEEQRALEAAHAAALEAGEPRRARVFEADMARAHCFRDNISAWQQWGQRLPVDLADLPQDVRAAVADFRGIHAGLQADYANCVQWLEQAQAAAQSTGQMRRAITVASNRAYNLAHMHLHEQALGLLQDILPQVRRLGWPVQLGGILVHTGEILRQLGQFDAAKDSVLQAFDALNSVPLGRNMANALNTLGRIELDREEPELALQAYRRLQELKEGYIGDLRVMGACGLARALLALQRPAEALQEVEAAMALARHQSNRQLEVEAQGVHAAILRQQGDPAALLSYEAALELAERLPDYEPEPALLEAAALAQAQAGQPQRAYELSLQAATLRQTKFSRENLRRLAGLRAHHQMAKAEAENSQLRALSALLQDQLSLLLRLSELGQEIATALEPERVHGMLLRQVAELLQPAGLVLYLPEPAGEPLRACLAQQEAAAWQAPTAAPAAARQAFLRQDLQAEQQAGQAPQALHMPLRVSGECLGVLSVWAGRMAWGEREHLVLRMLAAYGAVALANAQAYARLSALQQQLMQQERHAALGALVAGVAHELNTPIGNTLLVASTLLERLQALETALSGQAPLRRSELLGGLREQLEGLRVIEGGMRSATELIGSFKKVAVDRSSERRGEFHLQDLCKDCLQTLGHALRRARVQAQLAVAPGLQLDSYPGALGQVLIVLLNNALLHAFAERGHGQLWLEAEAGPQAGWLRLRLRDDGVGMPPAVQRRVFEPFFTTKYGQGGSGLGLSIAHNLVQQLLGGSIRVESQAGQGCTFVLDLPLRAP